MRFKKATMLPTQKETPDCGSNHSAGVNTQNDPILRVLAALERIAQALEAGNDQVMDQTRILSDIADTLSER